MHIIYDGIIYSLQKQGGITRYANELIRGVSVEHMTTVLTHKTRFNNPPAGPGIEHVECTQVGIPFSNSFLKYALYPIDAFQTENFLKKQNYQNAIFHSTYFSTYHSLSIPQVITVHDMTHERAGEFKTMKDKLFVMQKKSAIERAAHITCISKETAKDLKNIYSIPEDKISVIPIGVSEVFFKETSDEEISQFKKIHELHKPFLLFVGKRSGYKNFETFINAYAKWGNSDVEVVLVGGGSLTKVEKNNLEKLKIHTRVRHFDSLNDDDLRRAYHACEAFVFPSKYEGFGMPLLEAFACGTRVIAGDIPVFHELVGDTPIYVVSDSVDSIIKGLEKVLSPDSLEEKEYRRVTAHSYRWENTVRKTLDVYQKFV